LIDYVAYFKLFADGVGMGLVIGILSWFIGFGIAVTLKFFKRLF